MKKENITYIWMGKIEKLTIKILSGGSDTNIEFKDLLKLLLHLGFNLRVNGSHHILWKNGIEEIINIQANGSKAKPYQVKQIREIMIKYKIIVNGI
ncbi:MAG: type II toxin-antitoxin system HicA family toxin [Chitinophagales bacterium]|nr:type II toxin-antitoxin system HicA family toxin [Chitinophagales bacterium]